MGGAARRRVNRATAVPAASGTCSFCRSDLQDESTLGRLYTMNGTTVHYYCVLLSCCLVQRGDDEDGLFGFLLDDILAEIRRGSRLRCSYCSTGGATLGCSVGQCRKMFHLPCGRRRGALSLFYGNYKTYCIDHAPKQNVPAAIAAKAQARKEHAKKGHKRNPKDGEAKVAKSPFKQLAVSETDGAETVCVICYEPVCAWPATDTFWPPCCARDSWFHTPCLQRMALSAGVHYLKCPLCNDKSAFQREAARRGVYIPDRDAAWELEEGAFAELYERPAACAAEACACPAGRDHDADTGPWELKLCLMCGGAATHAGCLDAARYICARCSGVEPPSDLDMLERIPLAPTGEARPTSPERRPLMTHRMSLRRTKPRAARHRIASAVRKATFSSEQVVRLAGISKNDDADVDIETVNDPAPSQNAQSENTHIQNALTQNPFSENAHVPTDGIQNCESHPRTYDAQSENFEIPAADTHSGHVESGAPTEEASRLSLGLRRPRRASRAGRGVPPAERALSPLAFIEERIESLPLAGGGGRLRARLDEGARRLRRPGPMRMKKMIVSDLLEQIQSDCATGHDDAAPRDAATVTTSRENVQKPLDTTDLPGSNLDPDVNADKEPIRLVMHSTPNKYVATDQNSNSVEDERIDEEISPVKDKENEDPQRVNAEDVISDDHTSNSSNTTFELPHEFLPQEQDISFVDTPTKVVKEADSSLEIYDDETQMYISYNVIDSVGYTEGGVEKSACKDKTIEDCQIVSTELEKMGDVYAISDSNSIEGNHISKAPASPTSVLKEIEEKSLKFAPKSKKIDVESFKTHYLSEVESVVAAKSKLVFKQQNISPTKPRLKNAMDFAIDEAVKNRKKYSKKTKSCSDNEGFEAVIPENTTNVLEKEEKERLVEQIDDRGMSFHAMSKNKVEETLKTNANQNHKKYFSEKNCVEKSVENKKRQLVDDEIRSTKKRRTNKPERYPSNIDEMNSRPRISKEKRLREKTKRDLKTKYSEARDSKNIKELKRKLDDDEASSHSFMDEMDAINEFYLRKEGKRKKSDKRRKEKDKDRLNRKRWLMKRASNPAEGKLFKQSTLNFSMDNKRDVIATPQIDCKIKRKRIKTEISPDGLKQTSLKSFFPLHLTLS